MKIKAKVIKHDDTREQGGLTFNQLMDLEDKNRLITIPKNYIHMVAQIINEDKVTYIKQFSIINKNYKIEEGKFFDPAEVFSFISSASDMITIFDKFLKDSDKQLAKIFYFKKGA